MSRLFLLIAVPLAVAPAAAPQEKKKPADKKDAPVVLYAVPLVAGPGGKQKLVVRGKRLDRSTDVKVEGNDDAKVRFLAARKAAVPNTYPAERVGDSEVEFELDLPKGTKPGAVKLRAIHPDGESDPYTLLVRDDLPVAPEKEPNDGFEQAQPVAAPSAVEGTIKGERDADVFKFEGKKGDRVRVDVQAARFGSPVDAMVVLYDANRRVVGSADDTNGSADPVLSADLPRDGVYYISVIDAHDLGGPNFGYRLVVRPAE